ncbi:hypothetical protein ACROYT_G012293 [Oculina patagonica]
MKVSVIWSLIAIQEILLSVTVFASDDSSSSRSAYIETQENMRLKGHVVRRFKSPSLMACSHSCVKNAWCTSTNFHKTTCELNKHEISTINDDTKLYGREGSTFSLFLKECLVTGCLNGGTCLFDEKKETFSCSCKLPWTGKKCEVKLEFHFTTLGSVGKQGPTSNAGYKGTSLENVKVSNGLQEWIVPLTGLYNIELCGASGGDSYMRGLEGGKGAKINGKLYLTEGDPLNVLVGQRGNGHPYSPGAGGGGTFVIDYTVYMPSILIIAGGGGGAAEGNGGDEEQGQGDEDEGLRLGSRAEGGRLQCVVGNNLQRYGGYGGGYRDDGICCNNISCNGTGGKSFEYGGRGGSKLDDEECCDGGFGGGGASSNFTAGGGGGWSGGSVAVFKNAVGDFISRSGGGGSYFHGMSGIAKSGACAKGDGYVTLHFLG